MEYFGSKNMSSDYYVAINVAQAPPRDEYDYSFISILNEKPHAMEQSYCDGTNEYDIDRGIESDIPPILLTDYSRPFFKIAKFDYDKYIYKFLFKYIDKSLKGIECLDVRYEAEHGRWICFYGTLPIEKQLAPEQIVVYHRKKSLFARSWGNYDFHSKKITFETIDLTNILKLPFNCFMKAGINDRMRYDLRTEIRNKALEKFPSSNTGQTPWREIYSFTDEDYQFLNGIKMWSKSEFVLRKDKDTNEIKIYFNHISGDKVSSAFIMRTIKERLETAPSEFIWSMRLEYLKFLEGCEYHRDNHIERYMLNDLLAREICSYMI